MRKIVFIILSLFFISLVNANVDIGNNSNLNAVVINQPTQSINYSTINTNNSIYWNGHPFVSGAVSSIETDPFWSANLSATGKSSLSAFVPYTGAIANVQIQPYDLFTHGIHAKNNISSSVFNFSTLDPSDNNYQNIILGYQNGIGSYKGDWWYYNITGINYDLSGTPYTNLSLYALHDSVGDSNRSVYVINPNVQLNKNLTVLGSYFGNGSQLSGVCLTNSSQCPAFINSSYYLASNPNNYTNKTNLSQFNNNLNFINGTGANDQVAIFNGTNKLKSSSDLTYFEGNLNINNTAHIGDASSDSCTNHIDPITGVVWHVCSTDFEGGGGTNFYICNDVGVCLFQLSQQDGYAYFNGNNGLQYDLEGGDGADEHCQFVNAGGQGTWQCDSAGDSNLNLRATNINLYGTAVTDSLAIAHGIQLKNISVFDSCGINTKFWIETNSTSSYQCNGTSWLKYINDGLTHSYSMLNSSSVACQMNFTGGLLTGSNC